MSTAVAAFQYGVDCDDMNSGTTLYDLLHNSLILTSIVPHLSLCSIFSLAQTSRAFHSLAYQTPGVFRHLDLTKVPSAAPGLAELSHRTGHWRATEHDQVTEDE